MNLLVKGSKVRALQTDRYTDRRHYHAVFAGDKNSSEASVV